MRFYHSQRITEEMDPGRGVTPLACLLLRVCRLLLEDLENSFKELRDGRERG